MTNNNLRRVLSISATEQKLEDLYRRGIFFVPGSIEGGTALTFLVDTLTYELNESSAPIWCIIDSPGGIINQGFAIYDAIRMLADSGRVVNTVGFGEVSSMALCILQAGTKRYSFPNTQFMVHQASLFTEEEGAKEVNHLSDEVTELKRLNGIVLKVISDRCGMDMKQLMRLSKKTNLTINSQKAKEFGKNGLIDEIIITLPFLKRDG